MLMLLLPLSGNISREQLLLFSWRIAVYTANDYV